MAGLLRRVDAAQPPSSFIDLSYALVVKLDITTGFGPVVRGSSPLEGTHRAKLSLKLAGP